MSRFASAITLLIMAFTALPVAAKVSPEEAARLGQDLTPLGGTRAANEDGSIPEWSGGYVMQRAPSPSQQRLPRTFDEVTNDRPLFVITKDNLDEHRDMLSKGHQHLFEMYGDSYKMPVYPTRRTGAAPDYVYEATKRNALNAEMTSFGEAIENGSIGIPFPIPSHPQEIMWNHKTRFRGASLKRYNAQIVVQTNGDFIAHRLREDVRFSWSMPNATEESMNGVLAYFLQLTMAPPRSAGQVLLVHETMDQQENVRRAWLYNPGQRRTRRAPNVAYDNPGSGSDGLRTNDQLDVFNGATDRYNWKLVGKREIIAPYNGYKLIDSRLDYDDIIRRDHPDQDLMRYEKIRVWVVESDIRRGTSHLYKQRRFYVDEDTWTIVMVDIYDARDELWRFQEYHQVLLPWTQSVGPAGHMIYDFNSRRYLAMEMMNEEPLFEFTTIDEAHFRPANVRSVAMRR